MEPIGAPGAMVRFPELETRGWTCVAGIRSQSDLLELATSIGRPVPSQTGELVKELVPTFPAAARKGTLSETYGNGPFPLHTDTAFLPVPRRYVLFRVLGDFRRHTTVLQFVDVFRKSATQVSTLAERSIWQVRTPSSNFYCSMKFRQGNGVGWRYDSQCMIPVNSAAIELEEVLPSLLSHTRPHVINWTTGLAAILCNWKVLHGRGPPPPEEQRRILERVYVE